MNYRLKLELNYRKLAADMYTWRKYNRLSQSDCSQLIGYEALWGNVERCRSQAYWASVRPKYGVDQEISMSGFFAILELMHEDSSVWVVLDYFDQIVPY